MAVVGRWAVVLAAVFLLWWLFFAAVLFPWDSRWLWLSALPAVSVTALFVVTWAGWRYAVRREADRLARTDNVKIIDGELTSGEQRDDNRAGVAGGGRRERARGAHVGRTGPEGRRKGVHGPVGGPGDRGPALRLRRRPAPAERR